MSYFLIAGIPLMFEPTFETYFKDNLPHYAADKPLKKAYHLKSRVIDSVTAPSHAPYYTANDRAYYQNDSMRTLIRYDKEGHITHRVDETKDKQETTITLEMGAHENMAEWEYVLTGLHFMEIALKESRFSLHASALEVHGEAWLFAGPSGTGKTTHATHWQNAFGPLTVINDDKPLLYEKEGVWLAAGSPFSGSARKNTNIEIPLKVIVFLEKGDTVNFRRLSSKDAIVPMYQNTHSPIQKDQAASALALMEAIIKSIPIYKARVTNTKESARVLRRAIEEDLK